jgi:cyclopropane fatty-acyl-phospholipid synthase-like methyltransferase
MFTELFKFIKSPEKIIEIATGYGFCAVCLLEIYPKAKVYGVEPDGHRARISSAVIGQRGFIKCARALDIPETEDPVDCAVMIDVIQHLKNQELELILKRLSRQLCPGGSLLLRAPYPINKAVSRVVWYKNIWFKIIGTKPRYRSGEEIKQVLLQSGFGIEAVKPSGSGRKGRWFFARLKKD